MHNDFGFEITLDDENCWVVERWWGLWDIDTAREYEDAIHKAEQHFIRRNVPFCTLCDLRSFPVQRQVVADVMQSFFSSNYTPASSRTAVMADSAILKMQAMRVVEMEHRRFFSSMDKAKAWLLF
jgi:hypothetical protein